jgi:hypothetical protein
MAYTVFISHSDRDQDLAVKVSDLVRSVGAQAIDWALESETQTASNTPERIREAAEVIVVVTTHSADNPWLHWEIGLATALGKEITSVMEGIDPCDLPPPLNHLQAVSGSGIEHLRQSLIERVSSKINKAEVELIGQALERVPSKESKAEAETGIRPSASGRTVLLPGRRSARESRPPKQALTK